MNSENEPQFKQGTEKGILVPEVNRNCLLCGSGEKAVCYEASLPAIQAGDTAKVMHYQYESAGVSNTWHYRIVRCDKCGHRYADPIFSRSVVESSYLLQDHDNEFGIDPDLLRRTNRGYADSAKPYLSDRRDLQVDIGCDTGIFIEQSASLGYTRRIGIEPGVESAKRAAKLTGAEIKQKVFEAKDFPEKSIDFASLIHVLDHLVEPRQLIRDIRPLLREDGTIIAVVHNIDSIVSKISGEKWPVINLVHMDYFAKESLRLLFEVEGYKVHAVVGTKNYFPLHHLIRFAPFVPSFLRGRLVKLAQLPLIRSIVLGLRLGNIAVIASPGR